MHDDHTDLRALTRRHRNPGPVDVPDQPRAIARKRQDLIVRVAADIISELGPERATFREIATRAGVSKGVVEHHFENKDDIVRKTLAWVNERANERERRATKGKRGVGALRARLLSYLPLQAELVCEWKIRVHYWSMSFAHRDEQLVMSLRFGDARKRFESDIREAIAMGEAPPGTDVQRATNMLLHVMAGVSCNRLVDSRHFGRSSQSGLVDHLMVQLRAGQL